MKVLTKFEARFCPEPFSGCWLWNRSVTRRGYAMMQFKKRRVYAHRLSWEIYNGQIPIGLFVCHHCDVRSCVNPTHLFLGTNADNIKDAVRKGRVIPPDWRARLCAS